MDILLTIGFWIIALAFLTFLNPMIIGLIGMAFAPICRLFTKDYLEIRVVLSSAIATYITFVFIYANAWTYFFSEQLPIFFYLISLVAAFFGSGSPTVEANTGNKLMTSGEVPVILILIAIGIYNGVSWF